MEPQTVLTAVLPVSDERARALGVVFVPSAPGADDFRPVAGVLALTVGRASCSYRVEEFTADGGRGFLLSKLAPGTDAAEPSYAVFCARRREPTCECKGFVRWGRCKHAAAIGLCVEREWL